jgi:hypothetical protein
MTDTDSDGGDGHPIDSYLERSAKRQRVSPTQPKKRKSAEIVLDDCEPPPSSTSEQEGEAHERAHTQPKGDDAAAGSDKSRKARKRAAKRRRAADAAEAAAAAAADVVVISSGSDGGGGGDDDDDVIVVGMTEVEDGGSPAKSPFRTPAPAAITRSQPPPKAGAVVGVLVVEDAQEIVRDFEVAKLLRNPRYFDEFAEAPTAKAFRCFHCGQVGHAARDCTNQARVKPCYLCAQFGHDGRECPNSERRGGGTDHCRCMPRAGYGIGMHA